MVAAETVAPRKKVKSGINRTRGFRGSGLRRKLDFLFGVPLLWCLGILRRFRRPHIDTGLGPVGFIRTAAIGDTVLLAAILHDARRRWPKRRLLVFLGESNVGLGALLESSCEIVSIYVNDPIASLRILRKHALEVALDFGPWPRLDALLTCCSGAKIVGGFATPGQCRHYAFDLIANHRADVHELENYRAMARAIGIESQTLPTLAPPAVAVPEEFRQRWVALHPWPGGFRSELREWTDDAWIEVADYLAQNGFAIAITGGPGDRPRVQALGELLVKNIPSLNLLNIKARSLLDVAALLQTAEAVISVNTGIMHLAAALGVPTVGLNGPTSSKRWGPVGEQVRSVEPRGGGGGYLHLGFEYDRTKDLACMRRIHVADVIDALRSLGVIVRA
jgi:ADP-heptose:LPS heptosyltransferase